MGYIDEYTAMVTRLDEAEAARKGITELAASMNNPRFAAKMLGYDYKTFGTMLHKFKDGNGIGPADNSIFHDNGDVADI
jgi:hypothetical protein